MKGKGVWKFHDSLDKNDWKSNKLNKEIDTKIKIYMTAGE